MSFELQGTGRTGSRWRHEEDIVSEGGGRASWRLLGEMARRHLRGLRCPKESEKGLDWIAASGLKGHELSEDIPEQAPIRPREFAGRGVNGAR